MRLQLLTIHLRAALAAEMQYRSNFVAQALDAVISLVIALGAIGVLFGLVDQLNGWTADQLVLLTGFYMIVAGVVGLVVQPSLTRFVREVLTGSFDAVLLKPMDAQLLTGMREIQVWKVLDIGLGIGVVGFALIAGTTAAGGAGLAAAAVLLVAGVGAVIGLWFIVASSVFWLLRVENILVLLQSVYQAARWPSSVYPGALRAFLTFVLPVTLTTTVPAEYAAGRGNLAHAVQAMAVSAAMLGLSRVLWKRGLRRYSSASS